MSRKKKLPRKESLSQARHFVISNLHLEKELRFPTDIVELLGYVKRVEDKDE